MATQAQTCRNSVGNAQVVQRLQADVAPHVADGDELEEAQRYLWDQRGQWLSSRTCKRSGGHQQKKLKTSFSVNCSNSNTE